MLRFLARSILMDKARTLLSVAAVAVALVLIILLDGFETGMWQQIRTYRESLPVQLVALSAGTPGTVQTRSALPADVVDAVSMVPGVSGVYPLVNVPTIFVRREVKTPITVVGYERLGGPRRLQEGRALADTGEMVMDYALARRYGLTVGDRISLFGREFELVGLSKGTTSLLGSYVFIDLQDAFSILSGSLPSNARTASPLTRRAAANLLLIEAAPVAAPDMVRAAIEKAVPGIRVLTPAELAESDVETVRGLMGSVLNLIIGAAYAVGVLVIGFTLYGAVFERLPEYGTMKALGAANGRLYVYVLGQAVIFTTVGFLLAVAGSLIVAILVERSALQYSVVVWDGWVLLRSGVAGLFMAVLASLLPIRQVAGVDPAVVFRG